MAFPPSSGSPLPPQMAFQPHMGAHPFPMHPGRPSLMPMPGTMPPHMGPGPVRLPLQPPPMGVPFLRAPAMIPPTQHIISAPPDLSKQQRARVPLALSAADMKVATTVFVGNISDKASDTLVRQILLRCGRIEGWKRVQDASGKLQGFGFCEYTNPESTLRALRLLHDFKLGDKNLVVKVDSKTRTDLLKYLMRKKRAKQNLPIDDETIDKEVAEDGGTGTLSQEIDSDMKAEDECLMDGVNTLVRENIEVLSSQPSEDVRLKQDVTDALISMAKQAGNVDPDSTLDEVDMEDDMKTLVSDEIKKFRQSYKRDEEKKAVRKAQERERRERVRDRDKEKERDREREREREKEREKEREREKEKEKERESSKETEREKEKPERLQSPKVRSARKEDRSRSPRRRSRSRSRSREHMDRDKRRERDRQRDRQREREESLLEEEEYEERIRQRKQRDRDKAYREKFQVWESRERRKAKEYEKQYEKEDEKRGEMDRERRHLAEFLADYDDDKDDQRYYKGSAYARRRRERELEMEEDERDRQRERREIESLRLEVMERQARQMEQKDSSQHSERSPSVSEEEEGEEGGDEGVESGEDMDVPVKVEVEDIPLTKLGYSTPPVYPPIQVQSAPAVQPPEIKDHPQEKTIGDGISIRTFEPLRPEEVVRKREEGEKAESPQTGMKLTFGLKKTSASGSGTATLPPAKKAKLDKVFNPMEDEREKKTKKKLVPIDYSEEEEQAVGVDGRRASVTDEHKVGSEERKMMIQNLVNSIPTSKDDVFAYELKWEAIDKPLMEKRVGPWINKKIVEYIGEEEPTLREFICNKLACHVSAQDILQDIAMVLDDEAEVFVVKLWRLLIYETEARHMGIAKSY